jgi:uncharacterized membrane protein
MPIINPALLRQIPLFHLLDDTEAHALAEQLDEQRYWAGQMIFSQGDTGGTMYVLQSGKVEIFIKDKNKEHVTLSYIEPGELFGELSLLDNQPRAACAKALEETLLYVIDQHDLNTLVEAHPHAALDMMSMLTRRIREADLLVGERVVARNPNEEIPPARTFGQRLSDVLTRIAGDIRFVYASAAWFVIWITLNLGVIPGVEPFDPFPFGLLTMVVSLEAIFLSLFVLISQNRQAERDKVRNEIEYEVNIKAELEIRDLHNKLDDLQELLLRHLRQVDERIEKHQTAQIKSNRDGQ